MPRGGTAAAGGAEERRGRGYWITRSQRFAIPNRHGGHARSSHAGASYIECYVSEVARELTPGQIQWLEERGWAVEFCGYGNEGMLNAHRIDTGRGGARRMSR